ncbi:MAG: hypothetical protein ABJH72_03965 [Reichenbachiella sp.]|uniref:hypothetical protein n=1 Tax=Reichenbachiella sp. TaxID=2184521 RepID=UPI0032994BC7
MVVPHISHTDFLNLLKENGWEVASDKYFNDYDRIIVRKGEDSFPLQFKKTYHFPFVVRTCKSLGIEPPEDHLTCFNQYEAYKRGKSGKK